MKLSCKRCGNEWVARTERKPKTCPKCRSIKWEKELDPYWRSIREKFKKKREIGL